jgi:dihydropyrimidinase
MLYDIVIRNGTLVTAAETAKADLAIADGRIAAIGCALGRGREEIDATGLFVLPGGVDAHCHVDEPPFLGARLADGFESATRSAACGGTTTIVPFVNQLPGATLREAVEDYRRKASPAIIDYALHVLLTSVSPQLLGQDVPALMADGLRSYKVFMTYPGFMLDDAAILEVMACVREGNGTVMVHAENGHCVHWLANRFESRGETELAAFAAAAPVAVEREACHRAITLAELTGARLLLVHISSVDAMDQIGWARARGLRVLAETCPQYLLAGMSAEEHGQTGWEGAKFVCAPPPRGSGEAEKLWARVALGAFQLLSSDHCPYRFEGMDGKRVRGGQQPHFRHVPPGLPGLETRLPLLFEEGVAKGRIGLSQFVALTATQPAQTYGLYPRKGSLMPGADADVALWECNRSRAIRHAELHDACDYSPYEGRVVSAWPIMTFSRGELVWNNGQLPASPGRGQFVTQGPHP